MGENATYHWIWSEYFWFPVPSERLGTPQYGWRDLENKPGTGVYHAQLADLKWGILIGILFLGVRYLVDTFFVIPFATKCGIKNKRKRSVTPNVALETAYSKHKKINPKIMMELTKQTDMSQREIEVWMRRRLALDKSPLMKKFQETCWHALCSGTFFIYGLIVIWDKPCFAETKYCWMEWPNHHVPDDIYWYYQIELAYYWSLIFTLCSDHRRKDWKEMTLHHCAALFLLSFSWMQNFVGFGTLVLVLHDAADPLLGVVKVGIYIKNKKLTECAFVVFFLVWIITRLVIYPFVLLYATSVEFYDYVTDSMHWSYTIMNCFLFVLLALHLLWTYSICKIMYNMLVHSSEVEDTRSDESGPESEEEMVSHDKNTGNGIRKLSGHTSDVANGKLKS